MIAQERMQVEIERARAPGGHALAGAPEAALDAAQDRAENLRHHRQAAAFVAAQRRDQRFERGVAACGASQIARFSVLTVTA